MDKSLRDDLTGVSYDNAVTTMNQVDQAHTSREGIGFDSYAECSDFARKYHMDVMAYSPMAKGYNHVSHKGDLLTDKAWLRDYGNILFWMRQTDYKNGSAKKERVSWFPPAENSRVHGKIIGEKSDGKRECMHERNYFTPTGYRNPATGLWNVAKPVPYFAEETGADTSFIYTLLQHISGENYLYLLSWLRHKMLYPKRKTEVTLIFTGKQGTGKSSFGDLLCRGMFGEDNVLVTHSFNGNSRFNSDQTDNLIISIEEKTQDSKYDMTPVLKSLTTSTYERKENKGIDPIYQKSYTEYILTTNDQVPIRFDNLDQRRFMVMRTNDEFVRVKKEGDRETKTMQLADQVFAKLSGIAKNGEQVGEPIYNQKETISQFKYELMNRTDLPNYKDFKETKEFADLYNIPMTVEMVEICSMIRSIVPFIYQSLSSGRLLDKIVEKDDEGDEYEVKLDTVTPYSDAFQFIGKKGGNPNRVALNQLLFFSDDRTGKSYSHASINKALSDLSVEIEKDHKLKIISTTQKLPNGGFRNCVAKYKNSPAIVFTLVDEAPTVAYRTFESTGRTMAVVEQVKTRYNEKFMEDSDGCFEVLNPLKEGMARKAENCKSMNNFLLEADEVPSDIHYREQSLLHGVTQNDAEVLYKDRLENQKHEAIRLLNAGIVNRVVYSGNKSYHMIVTVKDGPSNKEERRWLDAHLKSTLSHRLLFDMRTSDASRLTRAPVEHQRTTMVGKVKVTGTQRLIKEKPNNVYALNWRPLYNQWVSNKRAYYEEGTERKILPSKAIYKEAAIAILDGTFWTDKRWNGQRDQTFFVAYRLIRAMGYGYDQVWDSIAEDIQGYYKPNEIQRWLNEKDNGYVRSIERELE
jgi:hypothetical protein